MPADTVLKKSIQIALSNFEGKPLAEAARGLLNALGYESNKTLAITPNISTQFQAMFDPRKQMKADAKLDEWQSVDLLFQVTGDELGEKLSKQGQLFANQKVDNALIESYLFFAIALKGDKYSRTELANITREVNKCFKMPALVIFKHGKTLTFSIIARRISKLNESKDVLEKVTLIKDVRFAENRAHIEILHDLALPQLAQKHKVSNFVELQHAWEKTLDTSELNKKFFKEIANWYFWAVKSVEYPKGAGAEEEARNPISVIRLITRLIFVWFIKEKGLVPEALFEREKVKSLLNDFSMEESTYYLAILQNLFFATLNTEMGAARKFRGENKNEDGRKQNYMAHTLYRHRPLFRDMDAALSLFAGIPFLNGGLFECLDRSEKVNGKDVVIRVDGFSDEAKNQPRVPNILFFGAEQDVDLNAIYATKNKRYEVGGLIEIFRSYKFTIEENTPIEEEIALDPELFGKVFENLLAAYNPETGTTARKQTGSFFTPREIVNYMVDEALVAYLDSAMSLRDGALERSETSKQSPTGDMEIASLGLDVTSRPALAHSPDALTGMTDRLRHLFSYTTEPHQFTEAEVTRLIAAIDNINALDPACGSGAFPMGILHKLVFILNKLDPRNERWKQKQISKAEDMQDAVAREAAIQSIQQVFADNFGDYGRKLFLIENCIYGVDIQPIAVQIAKLRFFISLVVEQKTDPAKENLGIRPLPNLETRFVAANTLIGIERPRETAAQSDPLSVSPELESQFKLLISAFEQYTKSRNPDVKTKWLNQGKQTAEAINAALKDDPSFQPINAEWTFTTAASAEVLKAQLPMKREAKAVSLTLRSQDVKAKEDELARVRRAHFSARTQATKTKYRNQDAKLRAEIATLLTQTHALEDATAQKLANWNPYDQTAAADFFDPEWMFGIEGGFDVVIGNPPYALIGTDKPDEQAYYKKMYRMSSYKINTYILFIEKGLSLLGNVDNLLAFIIPKSLVFNTYFQSTREQLLKYYAIHQIVEIQEKVFESAEVGDNILFFARKSKHPLNNQVSYFRVRNVYPYWEVLDEYKAFQNELLQLPSRKFYKSALEISGIRVPYQVLSEFAKISNGLNPGNVRHILLSNKKETHNHKKMVLGRDIQRYLLSWSGTWVNYDKNLKNKITLSDIKSKEGMTAQQKVDFSLRHPEIYAPKKILIRKTADKIIATFDAEGFYFDALAYGVQMKQQSQESVFYILGLLTHGSVIFPTGLGKPLAS